MAKQVKLSANRRTLTGGIHSKQLRRQKLVPAVIYGGHQEPESLTVSVRDMEVLLSHATSEHFLVDLEIKDGDKATTRSALLQSVQHHPVTKQILHVDLLGVRMDELITSEVPVEAVGEANGVKNFGGLLEVLLRHLEIECLPKDLPDVIHVDVTHLNIGDSLHVRDIKLPEGVTVITDADISVVLVAEPTVAVEPVASAVAAAPEVLKEKKVEGEAKK